MPNWNELNNTLSEAVLDAGLLVDLLAEAGCELVRSPSGDRFRCRCPVHLGDGLNCDVQTSGRAFPVTWACFSRGCQKAPGLKNNLLGLIRGALSGDPERLVPLGRAVKFIQDFLRQAGPSAGLRKARATPPVPAALRLTREQVRDRLVLPAPSLVARGFSPAVLNRLDIGESRQNGRVIVPVYDERGETCVGFQSRSADPGGAAGDRRWSFMAGFRKGDYLYQYAAARHHPAPFVLLVEGVTDALPAVEAGVPVVASFGAAVTDCQAGKLGRLGKTVIIAYDNDDAGRKGAAAAAEALRSERVEVLVMHPPGEFKDVGEMNAEQVMEWAAGVATASC